MKQRTKARLIDALLVVVMLALVSALTTLFVFSWRHGVIIVAGIVFFSLLGWAGARTNPANKQVND